MKEEISTAEVGPAANEAPGIVVEEQGPYHVTGKIKLRRRIRIVDQEGNGIAWQEGEEITPPEGEVKLCRCGHSDTKPFCDGHHHKEVEWDGTLTADRHPSETRRKVFRGTEMVLTDDESLCAGYAFCDPYGSVWHEIKQTADPEVRERLKAQINRCPSGRLQWKLSLHEQAMEDKLEPEIGIIPDGALSVLGGVQIQGPDGFCYEVRNRELLCRCGLSKNKPFCDGTHWETDFKAP
jgi:CDGSH-type Zn-finger protein